MREICGSFRRTPFDRRNEVRKFRRPVVGGDPSTLVAEQILPILIRHTRRPKPAAESVLEVMHPHLRNPDGAGSPVRSCQASDARSRALFQAVLFIRLSGCSVTGDCKSA